jgi:hypothetical protein
MRALVPPLRSAALVAACWLASGCLHLALAADLPSAPSADLRLAPTAAQLVEKNAAVRGGLEAWKKIRTMAWTGYAVAASESERKMPFLLEQQRPASTRFELMTDGQKSIRVFNASEGWKMRATASGRPELQDYSPDELKFAQGSQVIDGPLMDMVARGSSITLAGQDTLDGHKCYVLEIRTPEGEAHRLWLDAETYLEQRLDRSFHNSAGKAMVSSVLYRDYRVFEGLQIPVLVESGAASDKSFNRLVIERVALNPELNAGTFTKPPAAVSRRAGAALVDTRSAGLNQAPRPAGSP